MCQSSVEILGKTAIVATSSLLVSKLGSAAAATAREQEIVAVVDDGDGGEARDGLEVLSVLPAEVCPDTARWYLGASVM